MSERVLTVLLDEGRYQLVGKCYATRTSYNVQIEIRDSTGTDAPAEAGVVLDERGGAGTVAVGGLFEDGFLTCTLTYLVTPGYGSVEDLDVSGRSAWTYCESRDCTIKLRLGHLGSESEG